MTDNTHPHPPRTWVIRFTNDPTGYIVKWPRSPTQRRWTWARISGTAHMVEINIQQAYRVEEITPG